MTIKFRPELCKIGLVETSEDAMEFLRWLGNNNAPLLGLDVETDGLNWFDGKLRLVQFGDALEGWAIPYERFPQLVVEALEICDRKRVHLVGHNMKFDLHWLERHTGWQVKDWWLIHDTMLLAAVINSSGTKALKDLAEYYVHPLAKAGQAALKADMKEGGWEWGTVPYNLPSYWQYGVLDTILTVNLFYVLMEMAVELETIGAYNVERGAMPVLYSMERKGMLLDGDYCREKRTRLLERCDEIEAEVFTYGIENIRSTAQIALAFERSGVEFTKFTDSGKPSMDAETLELIALTSDSPVAQLVHEYRRGLKMANTYYTSFLNFQRSDGRLHPFFRPVGARTGRMSASEPAVQTMPRPGTDKDVRNAIIAPEGHVLISTDFSNVEARVFAHFANEPGMIQAFLDGLDIHAYTAQQVYRLDYLPDKHDPLRQISKNTLFCVLFGGGPGKVAVTAGVALDEATRAYNGLLATFPGIKMFQRSSTQEALDNLNHTGQAFLRGIDGRILAMASNDDRYYAFTNWIIQSSAVIVMKERMAVIEAMGLTQYCTCVIHDEIVAEVPAEDEEEFSIAMVEAMNDLTRFQVPIIAEPAPGAQRLGDAK